MCPIIGTFFPSASRQMHCLGELGWTGKETRKTEGEVSSLAVPRSQKPEARQCWGASRTPGEQGLPRPSAICTMGLCDVSSVRPSLDTHVLLLRQWPCYLRWNPSALRSAWISTWGSSIPELKFSEGRARRRVCQEGSFQLFPSRNKLYFPWASSMCRDWGLTLLRAPHWEPSHQTSPASACTAFPLQRPLHLGLTL